MARRGATWRGLALTLGVWLVVCRAPLERDALGSAPASPAPHPRAAVAVLAPATPAPDAQSPPQTSCREVAHVGDSTSLGLVSRLFLPDADDRIAARYHDVGVERFWPEISGARSMVETYRRQPNATQVVRRRVRSGYKGCWVMALGTNDPANTSGNVARLGARIDAIMRLIGEHRDVLWMTTKTLKQKGPYRNENMAGWNEAVKRSCARHPNVRVYDWAGEVKDAWFAHDGIHYNSLGYRERAERIADALARAFPKDGPLPSGCLVHVHGRVESRAR